jgi:L-ascorbate oxidase
MGAFYLFLFVDRTLLQSLLIEGRGKYNCALDPGSNGASPSCLPCNASNPECAYHVIPVEHGKTYRLRIASITSLSSLNFVLEVGFAGQAEEDRLELSSSSCRFHGIVLITGFLFLHFACMLQGHNLTVVTIDGRYIEPVVVENLDIYSGQSYSVLFTADQDQSRNYWAGINVRGRVPNTTTGLAVLQYLPNSTDLQLPPSKPPGSPAWDDFDYSLAQARLYKVKPG